MTDIVSGMKKVPAFEGLVSLPRFKEHADITMIPMATTLHEYLKKSTSKALYFEKTTFQDPFLIAYSSGTTGVPKCIVHSIGGALLGSAKEHILHREMTPQSVVLQYTTTGWIMYFASVMGLLAGSRIIIYDGSPFQPDLTTFIKILGEQKVTILGTSPRWMTEIESHGIIPSQVTDLSSLRKVVSTGMVLNDRQFEWFYGGAFPNSVHLANIAGGTDIVSLALNIDASIADYPRPAALE
jgi:acetoacetyl-CoA synthetase